MTDIAVEVTDFQVENLNWLSSNFGYDEPRSITLDISTFTAATHFPNGYIPSGVILGKVTANGLYGPYQDAAADGRQTAVGILAFSRKVPNLTNTAIDCSGAMLEMALVIEAKLPIANAATGGGYIDANGKVDLAGWFKFL